MSGSGSADNILQFTRESSSSSSPEEDGISSRSLANLTVEEWEMLVARAIISNDISKNLRGEPLEDNPFGSVYISRLMPDELGHSFTNLKKVAKIEDLSEKLEILFEDDLDDD